MTEDCAGAGEVVDEQPLLRLRVYARRWQSEEVYLLKRTPTGWQIFWVQQLDVGPDGRVRERDRTGLLRALHHDHLHYPQALPLYLQRVWAQAEQGMSHDALQQRLDQLGAWITACDGAAPDEPLV